MPGLFQSAIMSSGAAVSPWALSRNIRENSLKLAAVVGCPTDNSAETLHCLRQRPADMIVKGMVNLKAYSLFPFSSIGPIIEKPGPSAFIDKHPYDIIKDGEATDVMILWSFSSEEGQFPGGEFVADKSGRLDSEWDELMPELLELTNIVSAGRQREIVHQLREYYLGDKKIRENPKGVMKLVGDRYYYNSIKKSAKLHAQYLRSPHWMYEFSYVASIRSIDFFKVDDIYKGGACHGDDSHFVTRATYAPIEGNPEDRAMIKFVTDVWVNFMQGSMPSFWPTVKMGLPELTLLDITCPDPKCNVVKTEKDTPEQQLWSSLARIENSAGPINASYWL